MTLTDALLKRGYKEEDVRLILGGNIMRLFKQVWERASKDAIGNYENVGEHGHHGVGSITDGLTPV